MRQLRDHQAAAAAAACAALAAGGRATIVAAAGAGKMITAAEISRRLAPAGKVLVLIAQPGPLAPAAGSWARWLGPAAGTLITCAAAAAPPGRGPAAGTVTSAGELAGLLTVPGRVTALAGSAALPLITAAHRGCGAPRWDLIVTAAAHLAARDPAWAPARDEELIPAARRLYLTATPAITDGTGQDLAGLDNPARYGPVVHRTTLARAAGLGLAADYQVALVLVPAARAAQAAGSRRPGAAQAAAGAIAVAEAITTWDLREVTAVHDRAPAAARFTAALPAARQHPPSGQRAAPAITAAVLTPATGGSRGGAVPGDGYLTLAGHPDGVAFLIPQATQFVMAQAAGQALRHGARPVTTLIVPVLLPAAGTVAQVLADTAAFDGAWKLIRALRAHDERLAAWLDASRARYARGIAPDQPGWLHILGAPPAPHAAAAITARMIAVSTCAWAANYAALADYHAATGHASPPRGYQPAGTCLRAWLDDTRRQWRAGTLPASRAAALARLGITPAKPDPAWQQGLAAARAFHAAHHNLTVPYQHTTSDGFPLSDWLARLRRPERRASLTPGQRAALDALGFDWDPRASSWQAALACLRAYRDDHGHADVPLRYITPGGFKLGYWLSASRRARKTGTLPPDRAAALEQAGVTWDPAAAAWDHNLSHLAAFTAAHGHARVPQHYTAPDGCRLGRWLSRQRHRRSRPGTSPLTPQQTASLTSHGMTWDTTTVSTAGPGPRDSTAIAP